MVNRSKKILIIGNQGYIGSRLTDYLQDYGYFCVGVDIGLFRESIFYHPKKIPTLDKDVRNLREKDFEGFYMVIMLAATANDASDNLNLNPFYQMSRQYAVNIAKICKKLEIRYIFASSCSVYGEGDREYLKNNVLDEEGACNPISMYSLNKWEIEKDLVDLADRSFSPIALRFATLFGVSPRIRFDLVINMFCGMALTQKEIILNSDGSVHRPHVFIDDICLAIKCCLDWDYRGGRLLVLNVGHKDCNEKIIDIAKFIQKEVPNCGLSFLNSSSKKNDLVKNVNVKNGIDRRNYKVSFSRIHDILPGFKAQWSVKEGIIQLLKDLERFNLDEARFKLRGFYRVKQIEYLYKMGQFSNHLFFRKRGGRT